MTPILELLKTYGLSVAFLNVLAEQLGVPIPAYPVLVVTGALARQHLYSPGVLLAITVAACMLADLAWYLAGRRFGSKVLRTICRVSLSPDSCVRQTESLFARWGVWSLLVAKFIPGFGTIATALSGNMRVPLWRFLLLDALGAALFCGVGIGIGMLFYEAVDDILNVLENLGRIGLVAGAALFLAFLASKWWQRTSLLKELHMSRISIDELRQLISSGKLPAIIDARSAITRARDGVIPGSVAWSMNTDGVHTALPEGLRQGLSAGEVVVYCACPNEVSAAKVARHLRQAGFVNVRPLSGGIEAWLGAGLPVERAAVPAPA